MSAKRPKSGASRPPSKSPDRPLQRGEMVVLGGVIAATLGVALAMLPGGFSIFGPAKAFVLLAGTAAVAIGFAIQPALATNAMRRVAAQRGAWPALALLGIAVLATLTSIDPSQSLVGHYPEYGGHLLLLAAALAAFGAYALAEREAGWRIFGRAATVALAVGSAYALLQVVGLDPVAYQRELVVRRVQSTLGNASNLGVFLVLAIPLVVACARAERGLWRWAAWAATGLGGIALAWSLSRGAWVAALAGAVAWLVVEGRRWTGRTRARVAATAAGIAVAAIALTLLLVPHAASRVSSLRDPSAGTAGWRVQVFAASTRMIAERPLLGFGPASFRYAFPPRRTASMMAGEGGAQVLEDPHNLLASTGVALGVFGLVALVWLLAEALLSAWRIGSDEPWPFAGPALAAAIAGGAVALQFHFATLDSAPLLAVLIGLSLGRAALLAPVAAGTAAADEPSARATTRVSATARAVAIAVAAILGVSALLAGGLVLADRQVARGYALVAQGSSWPEARAAFASAETLAPWEPAMQWALGRGATQWMSARRDPTAFEDATMAMTSVSRRLPADSLVAAQTAEAYVVGGLLRRDPTDLDTSLRLAERAIALDPQNGFRWELRGTALAALGDTAGARAALERAVEYAPNDGQAWRSLAAVYDRLGRADLAAQARTRAASTEPSTSPGP